MSWEDELDELEEKNEEKDNKNKLTSKFNDESEEIQVTKEVQPETIKKKDKPIDYEALYNKRKQKDIEIEKEIEESVKNIQDPELRLKKKVGTYEIKAGRKIFRHGRREKRRKKSRY